MKSPKAVFATPKIRKALCYFQFNAIIGAYHGSFGGGPQEGYLCSHYDTRANQTFEGSRSGLEEVSLTWRTVNTRSMKISSYH